MEKEFEINETTNRINMCEKNAKYGVMYSIVMLLVFCIIGLSLSTMYQGVAMIIYGGGLSSLGLLINRRERRKISQLSMQIADK